MAKIPAPLIAVLSRVLAVAYSHAEIDRQFRLADIPGDPPPGSKVAKVGEWLTSFSKTHPVDGLEKIGVLIQEIMEIDRVDFQEFRDQHRLDLVQVLTKSGLTYQVGGVITASGSVIVAPTLEAAIRTGKWQSVETEYQRAYRHLDTDPAAAVTAACAILEAVCKVIIEVEGLEMPKTQVMLQIWPVVQKFLGLDPAKQEDKDIQKILTGLIALADGIACLRTHASSAHGRGQKGYALKPRHARLAVGSAHTLANFVFETWTERKSSRGAAAPT